MGTEPEHSEMPLSKARDPTHILMETSTICFLCTTGTPGIAMSCGIGCRHGLDPALLWLWLWYRLAAIAPIQPRAWDLPYPTGVALKSAPSKKKKKKKESSYF